MHADDGEFEGPDTADVDLDAGVLHGLALGIVETEVADVDGDNVICPPALTGGLAPEEEELRIVRVGLLSHLGAGPGEGVGQRAEPGLALVLVAAPLPIVLLAEKRGVGRRRSKLRRVRWGASGGARGATGRAIVETCQRQGEDHGLARLERAVAPLAVVSEAGAAEHVHQVLLRRTQLLAGDKAQALEDLLVFEELVSDNVLDVAHLVDAEVLHGRDAVVVEVLPQDDDRGPVVEDVRVVNVVVLLLLQLAQHVQVPHRRVEYSADVLETLGRKVHVHNVVLRQVRDHISVHADKDPVREQTEEDRLGQRHQVVPRDRKHVAPHVHLDLRVVVVHYLVLRLREPGLAWAHLRHDILV